LRHGICVAKMLDKTSSIICAFGLAAAAPRSPYRHLELCGIALRIHHGCFSECGGRHPFCFSLNSAVIIIVDIISNVPRKIHETI
ncbi:MAG: hypothetical protein WBP27_06550, partial [Gemmiger qucibialis]